MHTYHITQFSEFPRTEYTHITSTHLKEQDITNAPRNFLCVLVNSLTLYAKGNYYSNF